MYTNWIDALHAFGQQKQPVALVTVTRVWGSAPCVPGARMLVLPTRELYGTIGGGKLEYRATDEALTALQTSQPRVLDYVLGPEFEQCCGGKVQLLVEPFYTGPQLYIFGAGHIGLAVCEVLQHSPFSITLLDTRPHWSQQVTLPPHVAFSGIASDLYPDFVRWGANCYVLILTHDHKLDFEITALAISRPTRFVGLIGSQSKRKRFDAQLRQELQWEQGMDSVHCPVGLDIGGTHPREIALSIAAQLLQIHYARPQ